MNLDKEGTSSKKQENNVEKKNTNKREKQKKPDLGSLRGRKKKLKTKKQEVPNQ